VTRRWAILQTPGQILSAGPGTWTGAGNLIAEYGGQWTNSGAFTVLNDAMVINDTGEAPQPVIVNNGKFIKSAGTNTAFSPANGGVAFNNNGTAGSLSGVLSLGGGGAGNNGSFTNGPGSETDLAAGAFSISGSSTVSGAGATRVLGPPSATSVTFGGTITMAGGTFEAGGGTLLGAGVIAGTGTFNWSGGTICAALNLAPTVSFNLSGGSNKTLGYAPTPGQILSAGSGTWTGAGNLIAEYGSQWTNGGAFTVLNDALVINDTGEAPHRLS